jgi:hypothetical protein
LNCFADFERLGASGQFKSNGAWLRRRTSVDTKNHGIH